MKKLIIPLFLFFFNGIYAQDTLINKFLYDLKSRDKLFDWSKIETKRDTNLISKLIFEDKNLQSWFLNFGAIDSTGSIINQKEYDLTFAGFHTIDINRDGLLDIICETCSVEDEVEFYLNRNGKLEQIYYQGGQMASLEFNDTSTIIGIKYYGTHEGPEYCFNYYNFKNDTFDLNRMASFNFDDKTEIPKNFQNLGIFKFISKKIPRTKPTNKVRIERVWEERNRKRDTNKISPDINLESEGYILSEIKNEEGIWYFVLFEIIAESRIRQNYILAWVKSNEVVLK